MSPRSAHPPGHPDHAESRPDGRRGRPRLVLPEGVMAAQAVKRYAKRRVVGVTRRIAQGAAEAVQARLTATQGATVAVINTAYNFCWPHASLRRLRGATDPLGGKWVERTPAQAAALTDHRWSVHELLTFTVPPPVKRRGRRPRWPQELAYAT